MNVHFILKGHHDNCAMSLLSSTNVLFPVIVFLGRAVNYGFKFGKTFFKIIGLSAPLGLGVLFADLTIVL